MEGFQTINVTLKIAAGDSCKVKTPMVLSRCWHYKSQACTIFNKVIIDDKKCTACLEASKLK